MKIFLSWSGLRSRAVAEALNDWLRRVIQAVKPFYSPEIEKGAKWSNEVDDALEGTRFGIICLTPDNLKSPWIHYEAGALSKTKDALIWTFLHGLTPGDVPPPLGKFQHTVAEKGDVLLLLKAVNSRLADVGGEPLQERLLEENFELFWPRLEEKISGAAAQPVTLQQQGHEEAVRDERAILHEILELVRSQERRTQTSAERGPELIFRFNEYETPRYDAMRHAFDEYYFRNLVAVDKEASVTKLAQRAGISRTRAHQMLIRYGLLKREDVDDLPPDNT